MTFLVRPERPKTFSIVAIVAVIVVSTAVSFYATANGLNVFGDGYFYLGAARFLSALWWGIEGCGDKNFLSHIAFQYNDIIKLWPPFYPALLSVLSVISRSHDPYVASRLLNLFLLVIIGILIWVIIYRCRKSHVRSLIAIAIILFSPHFLYMNWHVLSEMFFIVWQLAVMLLISHYLYSPKWTWLILLIFCIACACMVRYAGVVMAFALGITVWWVNRKNRPLQRIMTSCLCVLISLIPVTLYIFSIPILHQNAPGIVANRSIVMTSDFSQLMLFIFRSALSALAYTSPVCGVGIFRIVLAAIVIFYTIILIVHQIVRQTQHSPAREILRLQGFIVLCIIGYLLLLFFYSIFSDDAFFRFSGADTRLLLPVFVWAVLLMAIVGPPPTYNDHLHRTAGWIRNGVIIAFIMISLYSTSMTAVDINQRVKRMHQSWRTLTSIAFAKYYSIGNPWIASNLPGEASLYLKIPVFRLPTHYNVMKGKHNADYHQQMLYLKSILHQHKGLLLYFNPSLSYHLQFIVKSEPPSLQECIDILRMDVIGYTNDCVILRPQPNMAIPFE